MTAQPISLNDIPVLTEDEVCMRCKDRPREVVVEIVAQCRPHHRTWEFCRPCVSAAAVCKYHGFSGFYRVVKEL